MDGSHVALVSLSLSCEGFDHYRADTTMVLGIDIATLAKVMKLADPSDSITLMAEDNASCLKIIFQIFIIALENLHHTVFKINFTKQKPIILPPL